jgi:outer membrane protein assembly factor BamB
MGQARSAHTMAGVQVDVQQLAAAIVQAQQQQQAQQQYPQYPQYGQPQVNPHAYQASIQQAQAAQHAARAGSRITLVVVGLSLLGTAVPAVIIAAQSGALDEVPGVTQIAEQVEHLLWDHVSGPPQFAEIGGKPAFIGRTRKVLDNDSLFIDAYDAKTVKRLWRIGPLGSYSDAYQAVHFAVVGDKVVVSDGKSQIHFHELASGELTKSISLTDKVEHLCVPPDGPPNTVWVNQIDEKQNLLDIGTGKLTESPVPDGCFESKWDADRAADQALEDGVAPVVDGLEIERVLIDGEIGAALAVKSPGTPVPHVVGFDPADESVRWDEVLVSVDPGTIRNTDPWGALAGGRVVTLYGAGQDDWYLVGADAKTGARAWETKLRPLFAVDSINSVTANGDQVFVGRTSSLEVFDAASGKLLGTVGKETYD